MLLLGNNKGNTNDLSTSQTTCCFYVCLWKYEEEDYGIQDYGYEHLNMYKYSIVI